MHWEDTCVCTCTLAHTSSLAQCDPDTQRGRGSTHQPFIACCSHCWQTHTHTSLGSVCSKNTKPQAVIEAGWPAPLYFQSIYSVQPGLYILIMHSASFPKRTPRGVCEQLPETRPVQPIRILTASILDFEALTLLPYVVDFSRIKRWPLNVKTFFNNSNEKLYKQTLVCCSFGVEHARFTVFDDSIAFPSTVVSDLSKACVLHL